MNCNKKINSVLIKPAGPDCNMACTYCFYLKKADFFAEQKVHRMSLDILEQTVRQVMQQSTTDISFSWQGGEPTLMGLEFFAKAIEFQQKYGWRQNVGNGLQTNGLLIDDNWVRFLEKYNFLVGLSLDGPEHIHDHYRFLKNGKGTWQQVMDNAKLMLDSSVAVNALAVVNDYSVKFPEECYFFFKDNGLNFMQFIPCIETNLADAAKLAPFSPAPEAYGTFLCTLFDLWWNDFVNNKPTTSIRFFESIFYSYVNLAPPECTLLPECGVYVVIEHNGDVFTCDFFVEPEWKLGNIMHDNLSEILNSERQTRFGKLKADLTEVCLQCDWLPYCQGGCTKDRLHNPFNRRLNYLCDSFNIFFEHADGKLKRLAEDWKIEQLQKSRQDAVINAIKRGEITVNRNDPCPCGSGKKFKKCCGSLIF